MRSVGVRDTELALPCIHGRAGKLVNVREAHGHAQRLAEPTCLIDEAAALCPVHVHFLEANDIGRERANSRRGSIDVTMTGLDIVRHHAERRARDAGRRG